MFGNSVMVYQQIVKQIERQKVRKGSIAKGVILKYTPKIILLIRYAKGKRMKTKRVFLIVLDSFGIGELPDADKFRDTGSNTLGTIRKSKEYDTPNLEKLGLFQIDGVDKGK